jgi:uncharacterized protein
METRPTQATSKLDRLRDILRTYPSLLVAYSGGVDSVFLASVAREVLGDRAAAVTARSPSLAASELDEASALARRIGIRHLVIDTHELDNPDYAKNPPDRCFYCKTDLLAEIKTIAAREGFSVIAYGEVADDAADFRPGRRAAEQQGARSPLAEAGLTKAEVRELSKSRGLPTWDKPATPCLASRIPYGQPVTAEKLAQVERAEALIRSRGFRIVRVRHHGNLARIEVPLDDLPRLCAPALFAEIEGGLKAYGFARVEVDPKGFRSGSLNEALGPGRGGVEV